MFIAPSPSSRRPIGSTSRSKKQRCVATSARRMTATLGGCGRGVSIAKSVIALASNNPPSKVFASSRIASAENRSGVACLAGSRPMHVIMALVKK